MHTEFCSYITPVSTRTIHICIRSLYVRFKINFLLKYFTKKVIPYLIDLKFKIFFITHSSIQEVEKECLPWLSANARNLNVDDQQRCSNACLGVISQFVNSEYCITTNPNPKTMQSKTSSNSKSNHMSILELQSSLICVVSTCVEDAMLLLQILCHAGFRRVCIVDLKLRKCSPC